MLLITLLFALGFYTNAFNLYSVGQNIIKINNLENKLSNKIIPPLVGIDQRNITSEVSLERLIYVHERYKIYSLLVSEKYGIVQKQECAEEYLDEIGCKEIQLKEGGLHSDWDFFI